jgi:hypothetical protein
LRAAKRPRKPAEVRQVHRNFSGEIHSFILCRPAPKSIQAPADMSQCSLLAMAEQLVFLRVPSREVVARPPRVDAASLGRTRGRE